MKRSSCKTSCRSMAAADRRRTTAGIPDSSTRAGPTRARGTPWSPTCIPTSPPYTDPGCVLHQGVGNVDLMLIAIDNGKDRMVFAGPLLSHYEFEMRGIVRKSDSEWRKDMVAGTLPPRPEWTRPTWSRASIRA